MLRLTFHITDIPERWPSSTLRPYFTTVWCAAMKALVQPSSHGLPIGIRDHDLMWREILDILAVGFSKGLVSSPLYM